MRIHLFFTRKLNDKAVRVTNRLVGAPMARLKVTARDRVPPVRICVRSRMGREKKQARYGYPVNCQCRIRHIRLEGPMHTYREGDGYMLNKALTLVTAVSMFALLGWADAWD